MNIKYDVILGALREYDSGGSSIEVVANYSALPLVSVSNGKFYWCESSQGTKWLPGTMGGTYYPLGIYYSNGVSWSFIESPYQATLAEVNAGTNTDKFVTPYTFANSTAITRSPRITDTFTATAGQTTFTASQTYSIDELQVYFNGSKLTASEYFSCLYSG
jgi:hypothetical protein